MPLVAGTRLGPYEIQALIGAGGMGEVYRAHDPRLGRDVAIKVAAEAFSERFTREARAIAALNHTNICHLYDVGPNYLVMEFVEGENPQGPMAFDDVLPIARQMIDGIEAAHEKGIVHRDLKPANIKITPEGVVKILDFGLAKALEPDRLGGDLTNSPTIAPALALGATMQGAILGTATYMAPEQAKGKQADRRSDIWSFGVVLYELLTGKKPFPGETAVEILGGVLNTEADFSAVPPRMHKLLHWCLEKDRKDRLQAIGDARRLLTEEPAVPVASAPPTFPMQSRLAWTVAALAVIGLATVSFFYFRETPPEVQETRVDIMTPATTDPLSFALSPDGRQIVFVASGDGTQRLWLRALDKTTAQPLAGTEGASFPFWSPDNRSIGFFADAKLKRLDLAGGSPQALAGAAARGGAWNADGVILFAQTIGGPLFRIRASGGEAVAVTKLDRQTSHRFPQFLPDGRQFVFYAQGPPETSGIYLGSLDGTSPKRLAASDTAGIYVPGNWLLFVRAGTLLAQRLDLPQKALSGDPAVLADPVAFDANTFATAISTSADGLIAYRAGGASRNQLTWFDRSGKTLGTLGPVDETLNNPRLSPDGQRVAAWRTVQGNSDVWILDSDRMTRFSFDAAVDRQPIWSPDGSRIVFDSNRKGVRNLYQRLSNLSADEELLFESPEGQIAHDWSPDGRFISFQRNDPQTGPAIWILPLEGDKKPFPLVKTNFDERRAIFSRDGRWVAYHSNESGRFEIYVRPFPGPGGQRQVSTAGGLYPVWGYGNKELHYLAPDGTLMAAPFSIAGQAFEPGRPVALFRTRIYGGGNELTTGLNYDVSRDGRFLINTVLDDAAAAPITLLQNWKPPAQRQ